MRHQIATTAAALTFVFATTACGPDERMPGPVPSPSPTPIPSQTPAGEQYPSDTDRDTGEIAPAGDPEITISPRTGGKNANVTLTGSGFVPNESVRIGFGPPQSEYEVFARTTADAEGRISVRVDVPDWATSGRDYLFVAVQRPEEEAISERFRVQ